MIPPEHETAPLHAPNPPLTPPNGPTEDPATRARLDTIPPELLIRICSHLDTPSALSVALVSRALSQSATDRLWVSLDLTKPPMPLRLDTSPSSLSGLLDPEDRLVMRAERLALQAKLEAIVRAGDKGDQWRKVGSFAAVLRPGSEESTLLILRRTAPNLRALHFSVPREEQLAECDDADAPQPRLSQRYAELLARVSQYDLSCLRRLWVADTSRTPPATILRLCAASPQLLSLRFAVTDRSIPFHVPDKTLPIPPYRLVDDTKLLDIHIGYGRYSFGRPLPVENACAAALIDLLIRSPRLRRLAFRCSGDVEPESKVMEKLGTVGARDILWRAGVKEWTGTVDRGTRPIEMPSSPHVRRLLVDETIFPKAAPDSDAHFPLLEVAILALLPASPTYPLTTFPPPASVLPLDTSFARWLGQRPRLHTIHFLSPLSVDERDDIFRHLDEVDKSSPPNTHVTSLRRGEEELLIVKMALVDLPAAGKDGEVTATGGGASKAGHRTIVNPTTAGAEACGKPAWQVFTTYDGALVPLDVIRRMRKADDPAGRKDWDRRGVEVGDAAWEILRTSLMEQGKSEK